MTCSFKIKFLISPHKHVEYFPQRQCIIVRYWYGKTQHEIVKWAIVIKHFTLEIEFASSACGFFVMCLTTMQIHNLPIQPKKKPLWLL